MSNWISNNQTKTFVRLSNSLTGAYFSMFALAASKLSKTDDEKILATWIGARDVNVWGNGMVFFDLSEMPWIRERFIDQKRFLINSLEFILDQKLWEVIPYYLQDSATDIISRIKEMFGTFELSENWNANEIKYLDTIPKSFSKCQIHGCYKNVDGCPICHNLDIRS